MKTKLSTIGIFDSGLGGLTGYRALRELLPRQNLIYFGDTARVPYGTRSREVIRRYALQDARFLCSQGVDAILVACGTASSNALDLLEQTFDLPFVGVVDPAAKQAAAVAAGKNGRVLVLGTAATVATGAYERAIHALDGRIEVRSAACPLFVPLVENGHTRKGDVAATAIAQEYLLPHKEFRPDVILLGCTHYPLLSEVIADVLPEPVQISAGEASARAMSRLVTQPLVTQPLVNQPPVTRPDGEPDPNLPGTDAFFTSDDPQVFYREASRFLGAPPASPVQHVEIEKF